MQRNIRHSEFIIGFSKVSLCLNIHIMAASLIKDLKDHRVLLLPLGSLICCYGWSGPATLPVWSRVIPRMQTSYVLLRMVVVDVEYLDRAMINIQVIIIMNIRKDQYWILIQHLVIHGWKRFNLRIGKILNLKNLLQNKSLKTHLNNFHG